jgi:NAD(P)-dependent dehydrogenase (short-subunit alcohol dehydrogenase family)
MGKLNGKVALITGGTSGIGFATAKLFVAEGAQVYVTERRQEKVDEAVKAIGAGVVRVRGAEKGTLDTADLKVRRIRVNVVSPGPIDTPGLRDLLGDSAQGKKRMRGLAQSVPLGRMGQAEEMARAVLFLASNDSSYVTGTELFVDGTMAQI